VQAGAEAVEVHGAHGDVEGMIHSAWAVAAER
jgi:hypothetical protein